MKGEEFAWRVIMIAGIVKGSVASSDCFLRLMAEAANRVVDDAG
jgi:hypothetical protein